MAAPRLSPVGSFTGLVQARRGGVTRRAALGLALGIAALTAAAPAAILSAFAIVSGGASAEQSLRPSHATPLRGEAVARQAVSPYYSNEDRERLARQRKETRLARFGPDREAPQGPTTPALNYDMMPAIEDIYTRQYTGNSTTDPVGGRKRYTYHVLFKYNPKDKGQEALKKNILEYIWFFKYKMSCRDVTAQTRKSPIDGMTQVTLEYPMKEYGETDRGGAAGKAQYEKATMVQFNFFAPVQAGDYIQKKFYADSNILRFMVLGHTRTFKHHGEDNELFL